MLLPMANDHYGFHHKESDFQGRMHPGYDYNGPGGGNSDKGTPLAAIAPGKISFTSKGSNKGWGNTIVQMIDMEQFFIGYDLERPDWCPETIWVKYAHCNTIDVMDGAEVKAGDQIATLGGSGGWSAHLHWDIKKIANGVFYYPPRGIWENEFDEIYLDNEMFIAAVNEYIVVSKEQGNMPTADLITTKKDPEIYYFNGKIKFHIPNMYTLDTLFGGVEIEIINKSTMKLIKNGDSFPSIKP